MNNFWDNNVWGGLLLISILLLAVIIANSLKRMLKPLRDSLIPASVLGGIILLLFTYSYKLITGVEMFDTDLFMGRGNDALEIITYHSLALGFIAATFRTSQAKLSKKRLSEIFNTGVTTVSTYLLQGIIGIAISVITALLVPGFFKAAGMLLPFGYGQGTGQALNYGSIFENSYGFTGGKSFGLSIAAMGFLSASIGGVIYLNLLKYKGLVVPKSGMSVSIQSEEIQGINEVPMQENMDKITIQFALVSTAYMLTYLCMRLLGNLLPGMKAIIYGFNFLLGVVMATLMKSVILTLTRRQIIHRHYINNFLMTRISNLCFDIMVVAGIAAIRLHVLQSYWAVLLIMGVVGLGITFAYNHFVADKLFPEYKREQFLMMFGMLTGTASTGIILLREIDYKFESPASENMVYQNFPAIVFGFPLMLLAPMSPEHPELVLVILIAAFALMNLILFRQKIFRSKSGT
jgi:ESS family glutamate:Na+ symporter